MLDSGTSSATPLATEEVPRCPVCELPGTIAYEGLRDRLYRTPGLWTLRHCPDTAACGTYWIDPRPTREAIGRAYDEYLTHDSHARRESRFARLVATLRREYFAHRYGYPVGTLPAPLGRAVALLTRCLPGFQAAFDLEVRGLGPRSDQRLLDVGCGDGTDIAQLKSLGWQVEGAEVDPVAVKVARERGLIVHHGTLSEQAFPAESFDVVSMSHVIEHLHSPREVLLECRRILKPGGRLIIATPNVHGMLHQKYKEHWLALDPPRHLMLFTQASLATMVKQTGFSNVTTRSSFRSEDSIDFSSRLIRKNGRYEWGNIPPLYARLPGHLVQFLAPAVTALGLGEGDEIFMVAKK